VKSKFICSTLYGCNLVLFIFWEKLCIFMYAIFIVLPNLNINSLFSERRNFLQYCIEIWRLTMLRTFVIAFRSGRYLRYVILVALIGGLLLLGYRNIMPFNQLFPKWVRRIGPSAWRWSILSLDMVLFTYHKITLWLSNIILFLLFLCSFWKFAMSEADLEETNELPKHCKRSQY